MALAALPNEAPVPANEKQWVRHSGSLVDNSLVADTSLVNDKIDHVDKIKDDEWFLANFKSQGLIDRSLSAQEGFF